MNISRFLPGLVNDDDTELTAEEKSQAEKAARIAASPKHGPRGVRYLSNGQYRRALTRGQRAEARKATKRHRRAWIANEQALARLQGQHAVATDLKRVGSPLWRNAVKGLEDKFPESENPVAAAGQYIAESVASRQAALRRQVKG